MLCVTPRNGCVGGNRTVRIAAGEHPLGVLASLSAGMLAVEQEPDGSDPDAKGPWRAPRSPLGDRLPGHPCPPAAPSTRVLDSVVGLDSGEGGYTQQQPEDRVPQRAQEVVVAEPSRGKYETVGCESRDQTDGQREQRVPVRRLLAYVLGGQPPSPGTTRIRAPPWYGARGSRATA